MNNEQYPHVVETILDYIAQHCEVSVDDNSNFVAEGLLDSFAILSLIMMLESEFNVKFKPIELANPQLQLVKGLAQSVCDKLSS
ncbi:acyl carrier protein [Shewanella sp. 6_MG-2023]|uniref:acyl carrier protein n=1 Tax=Shewanella sp. 6_MG-2023 TaxID=3062660 RepID=UPI0026E1EB18|nr:acyl carrier protein [Shewanella sp. 6_MG-2023]MDO6618568.1 acyl carrier protein [Shewanella sp. 6_MG-2023]